MAYTPGVAEPCKEISKDVDKSYIYTRRWNTVCVVTDGTAYSALATLVLKQECQLWKENAFFSRNLEMWMQFLCIRSKDVDEIVKTISLLSGSFGGVNLEDISAPRCFEIERRLKEVCDIPIFHDDQHGTAVVVLAAMLNGLKIVNKKLEDVEVVVNGSGAAGIAITKLLMSMGLKNVVLCDRKGAIYKGREDLNSEKVMMADITNTQMKKELLQK